MSENDQQNGKPEEISPLRKIEEKRIPKLIQSITGGKISYEAVIERILEQFHHEYHADSEQFIGAQSRPERMKLVRDVAQYIFAVESLQLTTEQQAAVIHRIFGEIYSYGPLDELLSDERVTTISLEGVDKASVRYGPGEELTVLEPIFTDNFHLNEIVRRLLRDVRADYVEGMSFIEVGMGYDARRISLNVAFPPFTLETTVDMRVHPKQMPTLDDLVTSGFMTSKAVDFLRALAKSAHGFVIIGDTESGKTTLLSALTHELPHPEKTIAVERTGEMSPPQALEQFIVKWGFGKEEGIPFAEQVELALAKSPECIILDEVRADEAEAVKEPLSMDNPPRQIWSFRGGSIMKRIRSSLTMVAQRANSLEADKMAKAVYDRLPFLIIVKRRKDALQLLEIAEWQYFDGVDYPDLVSLMEQGWEEIQVTGKRPQHALDLPDDFWNR